ncbi:MAG: septation regulator SpoVG [Oscillospiraceae bacterium]|nr:septation regulator SpoVG [Oscillospiraceae bacterium]
MNITQIKINRTQESGRMKAVVSVTFDHQIVVHDIKVIDGPERLFLAMPSRKAADGTFRDIVHPISAEARSILETAILSRYRAEAAEAAEQMVSEDGDSLFSGEET